MLVLTPYGYGTLTDNRTDLVEVKLDWGAQLFIQRSLVSDELDLKVKTFIKDRSTFSYLWKVSTDFRALFRALREQLQLPDEVGIKLYYPKGSLLPVSPDDTPSSLKMSAGAKLVFVVAQLMNWDSETAGSSIQLMNANRTARKSNEDEYEHVLANCSFSTGSHRWELVIDSFTEHEDLFIGVAQPDFPQYARPPDAGRFWGFIGTNGNKFGPESYVDEYAQPAQKGDVIGVRLEFSGEDASLSFSKNGEDLGTTFTNLRGPLSPAVSLFYEGSQVSLKHSI
mmetsp:Transcript_27636/g.49869  ORF Transcript_27636/g.49869 Transcript_27636/m.49869 type:complete len:282 (-) Transcript_27636:4031-4876(-)